MDLSDPENRSQTDVCLAGSHLAFPSVFSGDETRWVSIREAVSENTLCLMERGSDLSIQKASTTAEHRTQRWLMSCGAARDSSVQAASVQGGVSLVEISSVAGVCEAGR